MHFVEEKFAYIKKKQYLCTVIKKNIINNLKLTIMKTAYLIDVENKNYEQLGTLKACFKTKKAAVKYIKDCLDEDNFRYTILKVIMYDEE